MALLEQQDGLDDLQRAPPISAILWFYVLCLLLTAMKRFLTHLLPSTLDLGFTCLSALGHAVSPTALRGKVQFLMRFAMEFKIQICMRAC